MTILDTTIRNILNDRSLDRATRLRLAAREEVAVAVNRPVAEILTSGFDEARPVARLVLSGADQAYTEIVWHCLCWYTDAESESAQRRSYVEIDFKSGHWSNFLSDILTDAVSR